MSANLLDVNASSNVFLPASRQEEKKKPFQFFAPILSAICEFPVLLVIFFVLAVFYGMLTALASAGVEGGASFSDPMTPWDQKLFLLLVAFMLKILVGYTSAKTAGYSEARRAESLSS